MFISNVILTWELELDSIRFADSFVGRPGLKLDRSCAQIRPMLANLMRQEAEIKHHPVQNRPFSAGRLSVQGRMKFVDAHH